MKCADHIASDDKLSYLAWHEKSERSQEQGLKQTQCDECKRWHWPWEMVGDATAGEAARALEPGTDRRRAMIGRVMRCADHVLGLRGFPEQAWCIECKCRVSAAQAPVSSRAATQAERDAAVLEAVRNWRQQGQVGIPTPKGLAILVSVLYPGPAFASTASPGGD